MLSFIDPRIVAIAQIAMAAGTISFWFKFFRTEHNEPWLPPGFLEHERTFVYPDSVMSILMIISAVLHFLKHPLAGNLTLVCGGMMLFLMIIDMAYFIQHGLFSKEKNGMGHLGIMISMVILSFLMIFRFI